MFLALHPIESISLNSFVLLEHLAMLLTSTFLLNCKLRYFLNKAIGIINIAKPFLDFIDDSMILYLNSKLDLNLSCLQMLRNPLLTEGRVRPVGSALILFSSVLGHVLWVLLPL